MPTPHRKTPSYQETMLAEWERFRDGFHRSARGNLWRNYETTRLVVFQRAGDDRFYWLVEDQGEKRYSDDGFEDEDDALADLWQAITE